MKTLLHEFRVMACRRWDWTPSSTTLIHVSEDNDVRLKQGKDQWGRYAYSTAANIYAMTPVYTPAGVRAWGIIEVDDTQFRDEENAQVTSIRFRVYDGVSQWYWNGAAWAVAGASNWNTLAEINAHLSAFPVTLHALAIVLNLATTDYRYTPLVRHVQLSYDCDLVSMDEEVFFEGLVGSIEDAVRPVGDFPFDSLGVNPLVLPAMEAPFEVTGIDAVWDHTADPSHQTDLYAGVYVPATRKITLSAAIPAGNVAWVRFLYKPFVTVRPHSDIEELERVPSIIIEDARTPASARRLPVSTIIDRSVSPPAGIIWPQARAAKFEIDVLVEAPTQTDAFRLRAKFREWVDSTARLHLPTVDEYVNLRLVRDLVSIGPPNLQDLRAARCVIEVGEVVLWDRPAIKAGDPSHPGEGYGVEEVKVAADLGDTEETFSITGG